MVIFLVVPANAGGFPVVDIVAVTQRVMLFAEQARKLVEEIEYLKRQYDTLKDLKNFSDEFKELYQFSLEMLSNPEIARMLHVKKGFLVTSPPTWLIAGEVAGESYQAYRKTLDAMEDIGSISDFKRLFSEVYWNLERINNTLETAFPEDSAQKRAYLQHVQALGRIETTALSADAAVSRTKEYVAQFNDEVLEDYKNMTSNPETVNNPTKLLQAIAVGMANLQKMSSLQTSVLAQQVEVLSEFLKEWANQKRLEKEQELERIKRMYGGDYNRYVEKTTQTAKDTSDALMEAVTGYIEVK